MRQASIADMTRSWPRLTCPALFLRQASPWRRKMSATSSFGRSISDDLRRRCQPDVQCLKRALYLTDGIYGDPRISGGRSDLTVPEQILNDPDIDALLQQMGSEAVP